MASRAMKSVNVSFLLRTSITLCTPPAPAWQWVPPLKPWTNFAMPHPVEMTALIVRRPCPRRNLPADEK